MANETLKITAYPRCGIESDNYLPIDGILFFEAMRRKHGPQMLTTPGAITVEVESLPLARVERDGHWFYAASFAQWDTHADGQGFWTKRMAQKRLDVVDFGNRRGKVDVNSGRYRSYHMPTFYRHALVVHWFVVGDKDDIADLLSETTHIGKKVAQGNGRINSWQVEPWSHDWSVTGPDGELMRSVPESGGILYGIRPSYWLRENQTECSLP